MYALGVSSKHTLNSYLQRGGIEKEEQIAKVELVAGEDVGKQVSENIHELRAMPVAFAAIDEDGVKRRHIYDRAEIERSLEHGDAVFVEYQQANLHHVVDVPAMPAVKRRAHRKIEAQRTVARSPKRTSTAPGRYPKNWTRNHLEYRYRLKYRRSAPDTLSVSGLVESLTSVSD